MHLRILFLSALCLISTSASADIRLPGFFTDHMVLQREIPIPLWGWADPGEKVSVTIDQSEPVTATADEVGKWQLKMPQMKAGGPHKITFVGGNTLSLNDVLIGEVWLCSGQSNMEWSVARSLNPEEEAAAANYPEIRHVKIGRSTNGYPQDDVSAQWEVCSPETVPNFTAAGYYMARHLHTELGVPIGLLNSSWGGTRIEPWTPIEGFAQVEALKDIHQRILQTLPESDTYRAVLQKYIEETEVWLSVAKASLNNGEPSPPAPAYPAGLLPITKHTEPSAIFNAMMAPLVGYGMRGAVWYQGESNHTEGMLYHEKKKALVAGWRKLWGIGDFPFYYVQIAPFQYGTEDPSILPRFWEAQSASLEIPNTGMVVINDIGNISDIHPKNKQEVGRRLALQALKNDYGQKDIVAEGPRFEKMEISGAQLLVHFTNTAGGLKSRDGGPLTHFQIIGTKAEWRDAVATVEGDLIKLSAPEIQKPAAMRFAWHKTAEPNLVNGADLPCSSFRAGEVPVYDYLDLKIEESKDFELIYDLDLKKLGANIVYTTDRSKEINGEFDRIAYFIELRKSESELQYAYVSMDPFTNDLTKIGVPSASTRAFFQKNLSNLKVVTNTDKLEAGDVKVGNIEFWPQNYSSTNHANVPGASGTLYDFGDMTSGTGAGYGSMQIHNTAAKQTVFALNNWKASGKADLGIGNSEGETRDWTFSGNAETFESARLRVLVRLQK